MAYHESNTQRVKKFFKNPRENACKIIPFLKSKVTPLQRDVVEFIGIEKYSKPYSGHAKLLKYINKKGGFFVQCGGNDGFFQDPTYYLEKFRGWRGIIVEPLPISRLCQRNRKNSTVIKSACVSFSYRKATISFVDCNAMSFVKGSIENSSKQIKGGEESQKIKCREIIVPSQTIQSIIDREKTKIDMGDIDLFVADVEGYELAILQGLNFSKNSPKFILLEIQTQKRLKEIEEFLDNHNYFMVDHIIEKDYLFTKKQNHESFH